MTRVKVMAVVHLSVKMTVSLNWLVLSVGDLVVVVKMCLVFMLRYHHLLDGLTKLLALTIYKRMKRNISNQNRL